MIVIKVLFTLVLAQTAFASSTVLQVTDYDSDRQRANIQLSNDVLVPIGIQMRVNASSGDSCIIKIIERVNNTLVAATPDCNGTIIRQGLKLAYSDGSPPTFKAPISEPQSYDIPVATAAKSSADDGSWDSDFTSNPVEDVTPTHPTMASSEDDWPTDGQFRSPSAETESGGTTSVSSESILPSSMAMLRDRLSVYIGHNFSSDLEGKVYADGSYKDLDGNSAFSLGFQGRVYDISPKISVAAGLGYEFARNFDEATLVQNNVQFKGAPPTGNPRLTIWSLYTQVEGELLDKLNAFGGINVSIPFMSRVTWDASSDIGFQAGANYLVYDRIRVEGLVKISNLNLKNEFGQTTDVSLAGVEIRGRYTF